MKFIKFAYVLMYVILTGCSVLIPGGIVSEMSPVNQQEYKVLGDAQGVETSTSFLIFQSNKPDEKYIEKATKKAIEKLGGDDLINIAWYHRYSNYIIFSQYSFVVEGTVIKKTNTPVAQQNKKPINMHPFEKPRPNINGFVFSLSFSTASTNYSYNQWYGSGSIAANGVSGLRWNVYVKDMESPYYFYPQISYAGLKTNHFVSSYYYRDRQINNQIKNDFIITTIPITYNLGINFSKLNIPNFKLPAKLNPYANVGLGYYITKMLNVPGGSNWNWNQFGFNFGFGAEYFLNKQFNIIVGLNYHKILTGNSINIWDWNVGIAYYLNHGAQNK